MRTILLLLTLWIFPLSLYSTPDSLRFFRVNSVSVYGGFELYNHGYSGVETFRQVAPGQSLPFADLTGYTNLGGSGWVSNVNKGVQVNGRFRKQSRHSQFRVGLSYRDNEVYSAYYQKEHVTPYATTPVPGGNYLMTDSVHIQSYSYYWTAQQIQADGAWLFHTKEKKVLHVWAGLGAIAGFGFNGIVESSFADISYFEYKITDGPRNISTPERHAYIQQNTKTNGYFVTGAYIPFGVHLRPFRKNKTLSHLAIIGENQFGLTAILGSASDPLLRTFTSVHGGIRWYVH